MEDPVTDAFELPIREGRWTLSAAMREVVRKGAGVIVVLRQDGDDALLRRIRAFQDEPSVHENCLSQGHEEPLHDLRTYGVGAQILVGLGVQQMRVLGSPLRLHGLSGYGLEVSEYVSSSEPESGRESL